VGGCGEHTTTRRLDAVGVDVGVVCGVWCVVCGVWCVVCGVWCVVGGGWGLGCDDVKRGGEGEGEREREGGSEGVDVVVDG
jgi:hypothetical protein